MHILYGDAMNTYNKMMLPDNGHQQDKHHQHQYHHQQQDNNQQGFSFSYEREWLVGVIKKLIRDLTASSTWKCYRCNLIFHQESMASLHKKISNHSAIRVESSRF
jgi:hypothetical protein